MTHPDLAGALAQLRELSRTTKRNTDREQAQIIAEWERGQKIDKRAA